MLEFEVINIVMYHFTYKYNLVRNIEIIVAGRYSCKCQSNFMSICVEVFV